MSLLRNPKHERFAQGLASGKSADEAYQSAGYRPDRGHASRLAANGSIQARKAELQGRMVAEVVITRQWILEQLVDVMGRAREDGQYSAANRSLQLLGMESNGMFVERKEVGPAGAFDKMNADQLRDWINVEMAALGGSRADLEPPGGNGTPGSKPH